MSRLFSLKRAEMVAERDTAVNKAQEYMANAQAENRVLEDAERAEVDKHLARARELKGKIDGVDADLRAQAELAGFAGSKSGDVTAQAISDGEDRGRRRIASYGEQFVASQQFLDRVHKKNRAGRWSSGSIELSAATLTTDGASGGDLIVPQYRPGITEIKFERLTVADLLAPGTTDSNAIIYMKETTATNAAATVAEGAAKPESALVFESVTDTVKKIATWLPVTDEMLDDVPQIRSYIDERLRLFVRIQEEAQLLNGDGIGTNLLGLRNRVGMQTDIVRNTPDQTPDENNADAIHRMITAIMTSSFLMPDGIVMNPTNWQTVALMKDANGQYLGAGPFNAMQQYRLWGLPVVSTTAMSAGVALVGAFRAAAQIFRKGGIEVEASNSHSDYFTKNLVAIRAEERLGLAVYRPGAFGEVTTLT